MTPCRYPLAEDGLGAEERAALGAVVASGRLTAGERVRAFEEAFAARLGVRHAVMVNSGSSANLVATAALCLRSGAPLRPGDEVLVPCIAWSTTYAPLRQHGLRLRFVDVDLATLTLDAAALARAVTPATRMVLAVNVLGNPCDFDPIRALCRERGLVLFEDNCESLGARYRGRAAGTFGLVGTFSTFFSHQLSTIEGGLVATDDFEVACLARSLRSHGWTRDQPAGSPLLAPGPTQAPEEYCFVIPGYNVRPTELAAAVGLAQLPKFEGFLAERRRNAARFAERFGADRRFILQRETGESSWFGFTMIVDPASGLERERVFGALRAAGIDFRMITGGSFPRHPAIRHFEHTSTGSANADLAHERGFFVGNLARDLSAELDLLHETLRPL